MTVASEGPAERHISLMVLVDGDKPLNPYYSLRSKAFYHWPIPHDAEIKDRSDWTPSEMKKRDAVGIGGSR